MTVKTATVVYTLSDGSRATASCDVDVLPATAGLLPGQVAGKVIVGMSTDDYSARVNELSRQVGADHFFVSAWNPDEFMRKAEDARAKGLFPYGNMKTGPWADYASGAKDAVVASFAARLAAFGDPVRVTLHHEPGFKGKGTDPYSGEQGTAQQWVAMGARCYPRIKAVAPNAVTGGVINGFIMDPRTAGQGLTNTQLDAIFTDAYLGAIDAFGGDYYDGAKSRAETGPGAAWLKVQRCDQWLAYRGFTGRADIGEFNFIRPQDADSMTAFLTAHVDRWWMALNFNSDNNNRDNIPTIGERWNLSHGYDTSTDRRDAFRRMLDHPLTHP